MQLFGYERSQIEKSLVLEAGNMMQLFLKIKIIRKGPDQVSGGAVLEKFLAVFAILNQFFRFFSI